MMDFNEFASKLENNLKVALEDGPLGATVKRNAVEKLQGESYSGLTIQPKDSNLGMNINLDSLYEQMEMGVGYQTIVAQTLNQATEFIQDTPQFDLNSITEYSQAKEHLFVDVVGAERNAEILAKVPHTRVEHIRYQVEVDAIPKMLFDNEQWRQIQSGIQQELDVRIYAKPEFSAQQMDMVKRALITESHGYITMDDVSRIADPSQSADEMKRMLRDVRKESMQRLSAEKETADAQVGLQENGHYRYYSTQRPVGPGTFPKDGVELIGFENFDQRQSVDDGKVQAWGYVEYKEPLTKKQQTDYELRPAESHLSKATGQDRTEVAKEPVRTAEKRVEAGTVVPKTGAGRKRSVLADLHDKQAMVAGTKVSGRTQKQMKEEPR